jgi:hypothetical protein
MSDRRIEFFVIFQPLDLSRSPMLKACYGNTGAMLRLRPMVGAFNAVNQPVYAARLITKLKHSWRVMVPAGRRWQGCS